MLAFPTIYYIAFLWGFGPALMSIILWAVGLSFFFFEPVYTFEVLSTQEVIHLSLFIFLAFSISWVVSKKRKLEFKQSEEIIKNKVEQKMRDQFVNMLTHDLRSPLTIALGASELIRRNAGDKDRVLKHNNQAIRSLQRIDRMIMDLLDSKRITAGNPLNMEFKSFDLSAVLRQVVADLTNLYGDRFILIVPETLPVNWCEKYIYRAVENLASNAIKYGSKKTPVEINATLMAGERVEILVRNDGKILSQNDIREMLKPFSRLHPEDMDHQGWGIGLTIVRGIVDGHQGTMEVRSSAEEKTCFKLILPQWVSANLSHEFQSPLH